MIRSTSRSIRCRRPGDATTATTTAPSPVTPNATNGHSPTRLLTSRETPFASIRISPTRSRVKNVDDEVKKHLPDLPVYDKKRPIRIRDLLNHTSGLPDYDYPDELTTNAAVYKSFLNAKPPLAYRTGTKHAYCNFGYVILAQVVKAASIKVD